MEADHTHLWRRMIEKLGDVDLSQVSVMDFGCNQGGFLRLLYKLKPFKLGIGIDKAEASLDIARQKITTEPIQFYPPSADGAWKQPYDYVFSQEVLYLLPDLNAHARQMQGVENRRSLLRRRWLPYREPSVERLEENHHRRQLR